ncbi:hypothetical protein ACNQFZ_11440 [Schinkia sp. CFF1]
MANLRKLKDIEKSFEENNITTSKVGFYDSLEFIQVERKDSTYLEYYAKFVQLKKYDSTYLDMVREKVSIISKLLYKELERDGRLGACIDMSGTLSRILEKEGIWNHMVFGSLSIDYPKESQISRGHFWCVDYTQGASAAHSWLVVPPFHIVDLTIKLQPYSQGQDKYLPEIVLSEKVKPYTPKAEDLINTRIIRELQLRGVKNVLTYTLPNFKAFNSNFPAVMTEANKCVLHYIPTAISAPDSPFEEAVNLKLNGRYGYEIYKEVISPALKEQGF